jgi:hypothetical protein
VRRTFAAFLLLFATTLAAQTPDTATIHGQIVDPTRAAVSGADIEVTNILTGLKRTAQTDDTGAFSIPGLPISGDYAVVARKAGFSDARVTNIDLVGGRTAEIKMQMNVSGGATELTVSGAAGEIESEAPQLGGHLDSAQIDQTPLLNRRLTFLPLLNAANRPALNQGDVYLNQNLFTTNGSGRRQTSFVVDGTTANDSWGRQTIFTNIPLTAIQETTVLQNAFSAEYGATTGGVVNIVTKSGGSDLHGDLLGLWRPSDTAAKLSGFTNNSATSGNQVVSDSLGQLAASLSGPLARDGKTHFFFAGEYSRQNRGSPVTSPIAPGVFVGHYMQWMTFLRLDRELNERNNLFFRANTDSFHDTNPNGAVGGNNLPSVDRIYRRRGYSAEIGETATLSPTLLNNVRLQFQLASPITQFDPVVRGTQFQVPISTGGTFTSGTSQSALLMNRQYEFTDTLSASWGHHQVRFGADVIRAHNGGNSKEFGGPIFLGSLLYNTCTQPLTVCESAAYLNNIANVRSYTQSYGNADYTVGDTLWALFAQDDFHATSDLTLNLGLRYEQQTFTDARKNFAPRLGFAWNLGGHGKTVVRGGFGIYYSQVIDNAQANYVLGGPAGVFNFTATPGQVGFPTSVAAVPLPAFPAGAVAPVRSLYIRPGRSADYAPFFSTASLLGYPHAMLNPYAEQWTLGFERQLVGTWVLGVDYLGSHSVHVLRPLDVDPPSSFIRTAQGQTRSAQSANCTRPYWIQWYADHKLTCDAAKPTNPQPPYSVIQTDVNDGWGTYNSLNVNLSHRFAEKFAVLASYVWSHAINNVDPDVTGSSQNPNDPRLTGVHEKASAVFDQRHRFVLSGTWSAPWRFNIGGIATLASALPYNILTGTNNSGDTGATADRPVINGAIAPRNAGRGRPIYDFSPFVERVFPIVGERVRLNLRAEAFNVLNHPNFVGYSGTYGNGATPGPGFGAPLTGVTNQLPARSLQFSIRLMY